jgi:hypothetical protein
MTTNTCPCGASDECRRHLRYLYSVWDNFAEGDLTQYRTAGNEICFEIFPYFYIFTIIL